jgi:hypothetical protein
MLVPIFGWRKRETLMKSLRSISTVSAEYALEPRRLLSEHLIRDFQQLGLRCWPVAD